MYETCYHGVRRSDGLLETTNKTTMILKLSVLAAAILQVAAAGYLSLSTFQNTGDMLPVFIQPAGWAFSIWGLIYLLSFVYAVYQIIPSNDNATLRATRLPALVGFLASIVWLYLAGMDNWLIWLTAPVLFTMAISFVFVIRAPDAASVKQTLLSKQILFPYAAWTGIASWLNVQTLLTDQAIVTTDMMNYVSNGVLFACIAGFTLYYYKQTNYSAWYGGVLVWAGIAVAYVNWFEHGNLVFAILGGLLSLLAAAIYIKRHVLS